MYNPPGTDEGHEWIEVANTGDSPINLAGYRLFEGGVNHKLTVAVGTSSLPAGAKAIITTDPSQYVADYPSFAGAVFKSSFSLSNTAETISLKDVSLNIVDTYSYTAPPVIKEAALAKVPKAAKTFATTTKTSATKKSSYVAAGNQAASLPLALPTLPAIPGMSLYSIGLVAVLLLGAGAALYGKPSAVTKGTAGEFELE